MPRKNPDDLFGDGLEQPASVGSDRTHHLVEESQGPTNFEKVGSVASKQKPPLRKIPSRKLYQDEVYGTKELSPLALAVIDTPEFQRLAYIYQLGFTHTVFRGATHRRFDHSVGAYFMVRTLLRRIVQNHTRFYDVDTDQFCHPGLWLSPRLFLEAPATPPRCQSLYSPMGRWRGLVELVSVAGLLHDLGHVPVGHTMEDEFTLFRKHDSLGGPRLFEMLYGPRGTSAEANSSGPPHVDQFFTPIEMRKLSRPPAWQRVPLPWVFEEGTYDRFFPNVGDEKTAPVTALSNWEIRDLIYLILSFKETVDSHSGNVVYTTFEQELEKAEEKSKIDLPLSRRIAFIRALFMYYSSPIPLGPNHEERPLFHPFMADVVGNTICADLLDYLVRDGKRLKLDIRDNPRLQRYLLIRPASSFVRPDETVGDNPAQRLTINAVHRNGLKRRDTVSDLMDLMRERYRFAEVVYYHPKKAAFSAMIAKAIEILGASSDRVRQLEEGGIYPAPWGLDDSLPPEARHICHFGDESLLAFLGKEAHEGHATAAAALIRGILSRSEYRLAFTLDYEAAQDAGGPLKFIEYLRKANDNGRKHMEDVFKAVIARSNFKEDVPILLYCPNIRMQAKEVAAHVELTPDKVIPLNLEMEDPQVAEEIRVLNGKYQRLWRLYLFAHPRLVLGRESETQRSTLLSSVVDTFCRRFGVPEAARVRGARFEYVRFEKRTEEHYRRWLTASPLRQRLNDSVIAQLQKLISDLDFWAHVFSTDAPFPGCEEDYRNGFTRALSIVAADHASARDREEWPEELRAASGSEWYRASCVPKKEAAPARAGASLTGVAESLRSNAPTSDKAETWPDFVRRVAVALSKPS